MNKITIQVIPQLQEIEQKCLRADVVVVAAKGIEKHLLEHINTDTGINKRRLFSNSRINCEISFAQLFLLLPNFVFSCLLLVSVP